MFYTVVYISRATQQVSEDDLVDLLNVSRKNNILDDITGMLLYRNGEYMQALEGEKSKVEALYNKISRDSRHDEIVVLSRKSIVERVFSNWSMGFENLSGTALNDIDGYSDFIDIAFYDEEFRQHETAYNLLKKFAIS